MRLESVSRCCDLVSLDVLQLVLLVCTRLTAFAFAGLRVKGRLRTPSFAIVGGEFVGAWSRVGMEERCLPCMMSFLVVIYNRIYAPYAHVVVLRTPDLACSVIRINVLQAVSYAIYICTWGTLEEHSLFSLHIVQMNVFVCGS